MVIPSSAGRNMRNLGGLGVTSERHAGTASAAARDQRDLHVRSPANAQCEASGCSTCAQSVAVVCVLERGGNVTCGGNRYQGARSSKDPARARRGPASVLGSTAVMSRSKVTLGASWPKQSSDTGILQAQNTSTHAESRCSPAARWCLTVSQS